MSELVVNRRRFIAGGALAGGGLVLGVFTGQGAGATPNAKSDDFVANAWLKITPDDKVIFQLDKVEMGQVQFLSQRHSSGTAAGRSGPSSRIAVGALARSAACSDRAGFSRRRWLFQEPSPREPAAGSTSWPLSIRVRAAHGCPA